jgi:hypothetical protein
MDLKGKRILVIGGAGLNYKSIYQIVMAPDKK